MSGSIARQGKVARRLSCRELACMNHKLIARMWSVAFFRAMVRSIDDPCASSRLRLDHVAALAVRL
jgi:hypothetical protein